MEPNERITTAAQSLMERHAIPKAQLARTLGIAPATLSRRLQGAAPWRVGEAFSLAYLCGVSFEELLHGKKAD